MYGENNMSTKSIKVFGALTAIVILSLSLMASYPAGAVLSTIDAQGGPGGRGGNGQGIGTTAPGTGMALSPLSAVEKDALNKAILEEYGALNLYKSVIAKFGNVAPFSQIVKAEQQHINALVNQATKYGVSVPANPGLANAPSFSTLSDACKAGAAAEIADAALYDQIKPAVAHTDILKVFDNLQSASLNSHLPAFQTCK
jgi:hypothetical protein